jgi:hypothetical protein
LTRIDFITDEALRASLETDLRELDSSLEHRNYKAVHVLAGSVVEALLVDHVASANLTDRDAALRADLSALIATCRAANVISQRTADLSSVIRSYRNLIHPGRVVRMEESVNQSTASVARALVDIVVAEISATRIATYGMTAEQLVQKLMRDSSVSDVISHVLKDVKKVEIERLLIRVLPATLSELDAKGPNDVSSHVRPNLHVCFQRAFDIADPPIKRRVAKEFPNLLRTAADHTIESYREVFFTCSQMAHMDDADADLVKAHLLGFFTREQTHEALMDMQGITARMKPAEAGDFVDRLFRVLISGSSKVGVRFVELFLIEEQRWWSKEFKDEALARIEVLTERFRGSENKHAPELLNLLQLAIELPF